MSDEAWRPSAGLGALRERASMLARVRSFFAARSVLEVETPIVGRYTVTEPAIESLAVAAFDARHRGRADEQRYLQTSPEYAMKRLLAAGSGDIYQIARVFRAGEAGQRHNPEFTLLEWYRIGFDLDAMIAETVALVADVLGTARPVQHWRHRELLKAHVGIDWCRDDDARLRTSLVSLGFDAADVARFDRHGLLDLAYDVALRRVGAGVHTVRDFPPAAAALACIVRDADGELVGARFEVVVDGVELANGYHELRDAEEQRRRFELDRQRRSDNGQLQPEVDIMLLAALAHGLPDCAGVAVGLDRLLAIHIGASHIAEVLAFDSTRA